MPWFEPSERADAFTRTAVGNGWVQPFDWMTWVETARRRHSATTVRPLPRQPPTTSSIS
jgi:hypothetical protein